MKFTTKPLDRLGKPIEVGAFCVYMLHHDSLSRVHVAHSGVNLFFGTVTSIGRTGKIKITNVPLHATDTVEEKEIKHSCMCMQLDPTMSVQSQLLLRKLST